MIDRRNGCGVSYGLLQDRMSSPAKVSQLASPNRNEKSFKDRRALFDNSENFKDLNLSNRL